MKLQKNRWIVMSLLAAFFLAACGGGGGDSSAPPTPVVVTGSATGITNVGATLNGTVNPNGLATEAWFEWGTSPTLATFDNTVPKQSFAAGTTVQAVTAPLTGLTVSTTYYFRIVASNSSGVSKGTIGNFSTSTQRPTVTTLAADNLAATSATLHGEVNPNSLATQAWFEYGTDNSLATFTATANVGIGSGSAVVPVNANISSLAPGGTVYFRAAASNAAGEQKGSILSLSTANPPPVANAGPDNTVEMGQLVTLDGSGSTTPIGTITSYLWTQVTNTGTYPVTLSDNTAVKPTFTAPTVPVTGAVIRFQLTVTDSRSLTASDNVDITVKSIVFGDNFSTNTLASYVQTQLDLTAPGDPTPPLAQFIYDSGGQKAQVITADNRGFIFSKALPTPTANGVFSLDFNPTVAYPSHGGIWVRLIQDANHYYEISNFDWTVSGESPNGNDLAAVKKFVGGSLVDNVAFPTTYTQGNTYKLKITFSSTQVVLEGFGALVTLNTTNTTAISVNGFEIETGQQDAYYDNIKLLGP